MGREERQQGSDPHQPEVWLWNHEQRQEGPESLRDGEDAAHQQPCTCLCLRLRDKLETIFDSISPGPSIPPPEPASRFLWLLGACKTGSRARMDPRAGQLELVGFTNNGQ